VYQAYDSNPLWFESDAPHPRSAQQSLKFRFNATGLSSDCTSCRCGARSGVIRIAISVEAFEAIAATLPVASVGYENQIDEQGQRLIWLDRAVVDRLRSVRGPGESYSDVILRLASEGG
jgi:hypothetical protein